MSIRANLGVPLVMWRPGLLRRHEQKQAVSGFEFVAFVVVAFGLWAVAIAWDLVAMAGSAICSGVRLRSSREGE